MSKYRIVSNGEKYKIQERVLWFWSDVEFYFVSNIFDTEEEVIKKIKQLYVIERDRNNKNYKPLKPWGQD